MLGGECFITPYGDLDGFSKKWLKPNSFSCYWSSEAKVPRKFRGKFRGKFNFYFNLTI